VARAGRKVVSCLKRPPSRGSSKGNQKTRRDRAFTGSIRKGGKRNRSPKNQVIEKGEDPAHSNRNWEKEKTKTFSIQQNVRHRRRKRECLHEVVAYTGEKGFGEI